MDEDNYNEDVDNYEIDDDGFDLEPPTTPAQLGAVIQPVVVNAAIVADPKMVELEQNKADDLEFNNKKNILMEAIQFFDKHDNNGQFNRKIENYEYQLEEWFADAVLSGNERRAKRAREADNIYL